MSKIRNLACFACAVISTCRSYYVLIFTSFSFFFFLAVIVTVRTFFYFYFYFPQILSMHGASEVGPEKRGYEDLIGEAGN